MITLDQMRNTTRRMSGRYNTQQMPDSQLDTYINNSYTIFMPFEYKNIKLTKPYVFTTIPNVDTYTFVYENDLPNPTSPVVGTQIPVNGNADVGPPVYCQGYILRYFQDKTTFYNRWPNLSVNQIVGTGTGMAGFNYAGIIPSFPFYRAQLDIFGNVTEPGVTISAFDNTGFNYVITDVPQTSSNTGNLVDDQGNNVGTVDYVTGAFEFTVNGAGTIPTTATIYAAVVPYSSSRPTDVLFYNYQFVFRPCPQQVYQVEFQVNQTPLQLLTDNSTIELDEWYLYICAHAAKLIYVDFPDPDGMAYLQPILDEQVAKAQRRSLRQMSSQRAATIYSQPGRPLASWFWGTEYSGTSG